MSVSSEPLIGAMMRRGAINADDVLLLRTAVFATSGPTRVEADVIFALHTSCRNFSPTWPAFFIDAVTDYLVNCAEPQGYLTRENGDWLIERLGGGQRLLTRLELELLISVLDRSRWSPTSLATFALHQVRAAVVSPVSPLRDANDSTMGTISEADVDLIRRIIYAFGGDGSVAVTRAEAEVLFDIDAAICGSAPNPAWTDFFAKAIANVVMSGAGYAVPTREEALRHESWLDKRGDLSIPAVLSAMVRSNLDGVRQAYAEQSSEQRALARLERQRIEMITNEEITPAEASWLVAHLSRDGKLTPNEWAVLTYLRQESPKIDPSLLALADRLTVAA